MKRRKKESVLLFAALFITGILIYVGLANWERTPHLYEYDKKSKRMERGMSLFPGEKTAEVVYRICRINR